MSDRLTDEEIAVLLVATRDSPKPEMDVLGRALDELKARRSSDLTAENVASLEFVRGIIKSMRFQTEPSIRWHQDALATLDKLLGAGK